MVFPLERLFFRSWENQRGNSICSKKKIKQINVESEEELSEVADLSCQQKKKVHICVRVNPDIDPKTHFKNFNW